MTWYDALGFLAQILFSARLIIQWFLSEKQKEVVSPLLFWQLSIIGSIFLYLYGWFRDDFSIMLGQMLTYFIYIRNLDLLGYWKRLHPILRGFIIIFPIAFIMYSFNNNQIDIQRLFHNEAIPFYLLMMGIIGQVVFTSRFYFQWWISEKKKVSVLPISFWLLSVLGSSIILTYAIIREDYVLILGHLFGLSIYIRNIIIYKKSFS